MEQKKNTWTVWFKPAADGWISVLAKRTKRQRHGLNSIRLGWNGEHFASSTQLEQFRSLPWHDQTEIMAQVNAAQAKGWLS